MRRAISAVAMLMACGLVALAQSLDQEEVRTPEIEVVAKEADGVVLPGARVPDNAGGSGRATGAGSAGSASAEPVAAMPADGKAGDRGMAGATAVPSPLAATDAEDDGKPADGKDKKGQPPAKVVFGHAGTPAPLTPKAIGFYSRGCLAGAKPMPIDGEVWQVMRLSRNRNWGHPKLIALLQRLAEDAAAMDGWPGLLVGDLSQPRGGPMLTGHNSHQIGLDADVWLTPMPFRRMSYDERETTSAQSMLGPDGVHADPKIFTEFHAALIRRAASYPEVERIFIHPGIKKAMCEESGVDRRDFHKIRPYFGHYYHMHIRISCPPGSSNCKAQASTGDDDGCGAEVDGWIARMKRRAKPEPVEAAPKTPPKAPRQITLDDLPTECTEVAAAGRDGPVAERADPPAAGNR
jgi:penicillin-insensitive murein endopeptidase